MRWRLLLEEFVPEIVYIKGPKNVIADALSRLPKKDDIVDDLEFVYLVTFISICLLIFLSNAGSYIFYLKNPSTPIIY